MACDECHEHRVKCNGFGPCDNCRQNGVSCTYLRPRNKRGGASTKQLRNRLYRLLDSGSTPASPEATSLNSKVGNDSADQGFGASVSTNAAKRASVSTILNKEIQSGSSETPHCTMFGNDNVSMLRETLSFHEYPRPVGNNPWSAQHSSVPELTVRYPILLPVMKTLEFLKPSIACDMLETYFNRSAWGNAHLIRRSSILATDPSKVRKTKPALIYAMLCFAAQNHDSSALGTTNMARSEIIDRLFELTVSSLILLQHIKEEASLDDVISYVQLASMLSGSKYQKKSIEWWSATYQLARELKLNEEPALEMPDEQKEEHRRTWWLLYCVDRHQALSVRKAVSFRDAECQELLRPCDESIWNASTFSSQDSSRPSGIIYRITDCSFFGFILPLMSILGEIIELYNLIESGTLLNLDPQRNQIKHHLDIYDHSLHQCRFHPEEAELVKCYARHILSTLHILVAGQWDPLDMFADAEARGLSSEIIYSAALATIAANTVRDIQLLDPSFAFMPLFFGLFLLHCSFPLLLIMKTFGLQSDANIIGACEIVIEAHEASIIAIGRDYRDAFWTSFAGVASDIKAALKTTPCPEAALRTMLDIRCKVREILGLFRWNKTGHGLNT